MLLAALLLSAALPARALDIPASSAAVPASTAASSAAQPPAWARPLHGVHITGWAAGSPKARRRLIRDIREAGLNAAVVALKEYDGVMFVKGVPLAQEVGAYSDAIPDLEECVRDFKAAGLYTIARIVLFKDNRLARRRPDLAVRRAGGGIWRNAKGVAWVDPYRREVWEYNLEIASRAAAAGFDEIQFDYVRFPSDGNVRACRYSRPDHNDRTANHNLLSFLSLARQRLEPMGVKLSICVFGMTASDDSGMGIGQHITELTKEIDYVSPMMYPSHYARGSYGLKNPNREPYKTVEHGTRDAVERLGAEAWKLRPYLQDFSLGFRYREPQVRAQILAAARQGVTSWILWNPKNRYTWSALRHNNQPVSAFTPPAGSRDP